jgi:hypothetical protein
MSLLHHYDPEQMYKGSVVPEGTFAICTFVVHNYVNLNIGLALTLYQAICYFLQWVGVGIAIGLIYRPS